jgi:hypothetical protein
MSGLRKSPDSGKLRKGAFRRVAESITDPEQLRCWKVDGIYYVHDRGYAVFVFSVSEESLSR